MNYVQQLMLEKKATIITTDQLQQNVITKIHVTLNLTVEGSQEITTDLA